MADLLLQGKPFHIMPAADLLAAVLKLQKLPASGKRSGLNQKTDQNITKIVSRDNFIRIPGWHKRTEHTQHHAQHGNRHRQPFTLIQGCQQRRQNKHHIYGRKSAMDDGNHKAKQRHRDCHHAVFLIFFPFGILNELPAAQHQRSIDDGRHHNITKQISWYSTADQRCGIQDKEQ